MRQHGGHFQSALAVPPEGVRAGHELGRVFLQKSEPHVVRHRVGHLLTVEILELRLEVEQVNLADPALHVEEDAVPGARREVGRLGRQRAGWGLPIAPNRLPGRSQKTVGFEQRGEGQAADAAGGVDQKIASGQLNELVRFHGSSQ